MLRHGLDSPSGSGPSQSTRPLPRLTHADSQEPIAIQFDLTGIDNNGSPLKDEQDRHQLYGSKKKGHSTKNITFASPGAIYSFEKSEGGVYGSTGRYLGRWSCEEDVVKWTAENNAIDRAAELAERAQKENKERLDWEALEPFRKAYHGRLNYRQQQMLLAQVLQYLTTFKRED